MILGLAGAAELWVLAWSLSPERRGRRRPRVALVLAALVVATTVFLEIRTERLALEQLGYEFAPQVLEQSERRELALTAAMREIQDNYRVLDVLLQPRGSETEFLAYRAWVSGQLYHSRYKSSLDIYTPTASSSATSASTCRRSTRPPGEILHATDLNLRHEEFLAGISVQKRLLHAEAPLIRGGETVAVAIGHVLDDPENLPFLPWSRPYLAALGPGARPRGTEQTEGPHYVLYDERGAVTLSTLRRPPQKTDELMRAAVSGESVRIRSGEEGLVGITMLDDDGRLHALLLHRRGKVDRLAAAARAMLLALAFALLVPFRFDRLRPRGLLELLRLIRGVALPQTARRGARRLGGPARRSGAVSPGLHRTSRRGGAGGQGGGVRRRDPAGRRRLLDRGLQRSGGNHAARRQPAPLAATRGRTRRSTSTIAAGSWPAPNGSCSIPVCCRCVWTGISTARSSAKVVRC